MRSKVAGFGAVAVFGLLVQVSQVFMQPIGPPRFRSEWQRRRTDITLAELLTVQPGASVPLVIHVRSREGLQLVPSTPDDPYLVAAALALDGTRELAIVRTEFGTPQARPSRC